MICHHGNLKNGDKFDPVPTLTAELCGANLNMGYTETQIWNQRCQQTYKLLLQIWIQFFGSRNSHFWIKHPVFIVYAEGLVFIGIHIVFF